MQRTRKLILVAAATTALAAEEAEDRQLHLADAVQRGGDHARERALRARLHAPVEADDRVQADVGARRGVERLGAAEAEADEHDVRDARRLAQLRC